MALSPFHSAGFSVISVSAVQSHRPKRQGVWLSPPAGQSPGWLTYGPYHTPAAEGPGQVVRFRLAIDVASGGSDLVARIDVSDYDAGVEVLARRDIRRDEFQGGLDNFSEFALSFDTTGRAGHRLEYRVYWYGTARLAHDRTIVVWRDSANTTTYEYDVLGNLVQVTDAAGNVTTMEYDPLGRKVKMNDPDMGEWTYEYDAAGNLRRQTDARGCVIDFSYDRINRLTGKSYSGACNDLPVSYTYDEGVYGKGHRTRMEDGSGYTTWVYDKRGRVTEERKVINGSGGGTFVTQWHYDALDRVDWMKYPGGSGGQVGEKVNYTYNAQGLVNKVYGSSTYVQSTSYDAVGRVEVRKLGNDVLRTAYVYYPWTRANGMGRLQRIKTGTPSNATSLQDLRYFYDAVGNVTRIEDWKAASPQTQRFTYDALNRLTYAWTTGGGSGSYDEYYEYDVIGNLTDKSGVLYGYHDGAHKHAVTHLNGTRKYWYDANGNQTTRRVGSDTYTLTYDGENRLTEVRKDGEVVAEFVYDGEGERVKATVGGVTTVYVGEYYEKQGSTVRKYYYAGGVRVAVREGSSLYWLLTDHLGSTAIIANSSGGKTGELRYYAWGGTRYEWGSQPTAYRYTGQRLEAAIGLYYYRARWYDPALGRFIQPDTIVPNPGNPQDLNRYAYVRNNPLKYIDPSGHLFIGNWGLPPLDDDGTGGTNNPHGPGMPYRRGDGLPRIAPPVPLENVHMLAQWFGATSFAERQGAALNYTGYAQGLHPAIDLSAPGGISVHAVVGGKVIGIHYAAHNTWIDILSGNFIYRYQHLQNLQVAVDDLITEGQVIGEVHNTVRNAEGIVIHFAHLHFEIRDAAQTMMFNPVLFLTGDYTYQLAVSARDYARNGGAGVTYNGAYLDPFNTMVIRHAAGTFHPPQAAYLNTFPYKQGW